MSLNLKIGLVLGALVAVLGTGYLFIVKTGAPFVDNSFSPALSPQASGSAAFQDGSADDFVASLESDVALENSLSQEESANLDQSINSESQAISDFGQSYDANEL